MLSSTPDNASPIFRTVSKSTVLFAISHTHSLEVNVLILEALVAAIIPKNRNFFNISLSGAQTSALAAPDLCASFP
jgi:hypothetical protein